MEVNKCGSDSIILVCYPYNLLNITTIKLIIMLNIVYAFDENYNKQALYQYVV